MVDDFEAEDIVAVLALARRSLSEEFPYAMLLQLSQSHPHLVKVARDPATGRVAGFIVGTKEPGLGGRVLLFAVDPEYQGLGAGRQLLRALQQELAMEDVRQVRLEVRQDNPRAVDFYQRNGFAVTGIEPRAYKDGTDAFTMMKPLY